MARYTAKMMNEDIDDYNRYLEEAGSFMRLALGHQNGHNIVHESYLPGGEIPEGHYQQVGGGSPKETRDGAYRCYRNEMARIRQKQTEALESENKRLKARIAELEG